MKIIYKKEGFDLSDEGEQVEKIENEIDLQKRLDKLPPHIKKIGELIKDGYTYKEIAEEMGTTEGAIKQTLLRFRRKA